jgi:tungstate transport system substrate-binding protein
MTRPGRPGIIVFTKHLARVQPLALLAAALFAMPALAADRSFILQSTTSTADSGLYDFLLPIFTEQTGITVNVVAVGTGQAIKNSQNGDGDVLLVHARAAEEQFVAEGYGVERFDVMYNDFVIVGPPADPAGIGRAMNAPAALAKIAAVKAPFASRADSSGTHQKEMELWRAAGVDPTKDSGTWYRETGSGMGATLNAAVGMGAYAITDRGTWIGFKNKGDYAILVEGDRNLINEYGIILVNPKKHPNVKVGEGRAFIDWILSDAGQAAIASYKLDGQQLFFPGTKRSPEGLVADWPEALSGAPR